MRMPVLKARAKVTIRARMALERAGAGVLVERRGKLHRVEAPRALRGGVGCASRGGLALGVSQRVPLNLAGRAAWRGGGRRGENAVGVSRAIVDQPDRVGEREGRQRKGVLRGQPLDASAK